MDYGQKSTGLVSAATPIPTLLNVSIRSANNCANAEGIGNQLRNMLDALGGGQPEDPRRNGEVSQATSYIHEADMLNDRMGRALDFLQIQVNRLEQYFGK
jgi:hypothetical protein